MSFDVDLVHDVTINAREFAKVAQNSIEIAVVAMAMAIELNMGEDLIRLTGLAGMLHDWGMVYVPKEIRESKAYLTPAQFHEIAKHPMYTANMLQRVEGLPHRVALICYQVHERPDGSGYPRGRQQSSIHQCARLLNVADTYVALTSLRPFRPPLKPHAALECLLRKAAKRKVDATAVAALLRAMTQFGIGRHVELSDQSTGIVRRRNGEKYYAPMIEILEDGDGTRPDACEGLMDPEKCGLKVTRVLPMAGRHEIGFSPKLLSIPRK